MANMLGRKLPRGVLTHYRYQSHMWRGGRGVDWTTQLELVRERSHCASTQRIWRGIFLAVLWRFIGRSLSKSLQATAIVAVALRFSLLAVLLFSKILPIVDCAPTVHRASYEYGVEDPLDYDIHVPLSAMPLGINVGPSLEILSFRKGDKTGELSWIARSGWLSVGDKLLALEGRDVSQLKPRDFADALHNEVKSKRSEARSLALAPEVEREAGGFVTLRIRPAEQPGRQRRTSDMYSPRSQEESEEERSVWHLTFSNGLLSEDTVKVTASTFGAKPGGCDAMPVVVANPQDSCSSLFNAGQVLGAHVLVHRGGCSFFAKAKAIDNAGGGSLIVIDAGAGRLRMEAENGQHVSIPVSMVSKLDGEVLEKAATSTSRTRGRLVAKLSVTAECLPRDVAPHFSQGQSPMYPRRLFSAEDLPSNVINDSISPLAGKTQAKSSASRSEAKVGVHSDGLERKVDEEARPEDITPTVAGALTSVGGGEDFGKYRETTLGPLRGGHLILEAADKTEHSLEFISAPVTGSLSINLVDEEQVRAGDDIGGDTSFVAILEDCYHPDMEDMATGNIFLLVPPDRGCFVSRQPPSVGAGIVVVIAGKTEAVTSLAMAGDAWNTKRPHTAMLSPVNQGQPRRVDEVDSLDVEHGGTWQWRHASDEGDSIEAGIRRDCGGFCLPSLSVGQLGEDGACRPQLIFVGYEDGVGILRWIIETHGRDNWAAHEPIVRLKARLEERDDVGRLWGDVLWASDRRNWPRGDKTRRRILNRLRRTHSPEHASQPTAAGISTANGGRWRLIQEAFDSLSQEEPETPCALPEGEPHPQGSEGIDV